MIIYALSSSRSPTYYRYVGKTIQDPKIRLRDHTGNQLRSGIYCKNWIKKEQNLGNTILLSEIEYCKEEDLSREIYWIRTLREWGYDLTNLTIGGEGMSGYKHSEETKSKISKANTGKVGWSKNKKLPQHSALMKEKYTKGLWQHPHSFMTTEKIKEGYEKKSMVSSKCVYVIDDNNTILKKFNSPKEAGKYLNVNIDGIRHTAHNRANGGIWSYMGYIFTYDPSVLPKLNKEDIFKNRAHKTSMVKKLKILQYNTYLEQLRIEFDTMKLEREHELKILELDLKRIDLEIKAKSSDEKVKLDLEQAKNDKEFQMKKLQKEVEIKEKELQIKRKQKSSSNK